MSKKQHKFLAQKEPKKPQGKKGKKSKGLKWVLLSILLILLTAIVVVAVYITATLNQIKRPDSDESFITPEQAASIPDETDIPIDKDNNATEAEQTDVTWSTEVLEGTPIGEEENVINILLIGQDRRPGEGRARSDSMILVSVNKEKEKVSMVSFLRDNYVQIPGGYYDNRLNVAYNYGGMELLDETLEKNFNVHIDANVEVDFTHFTEIIDLLGGVDIELTSAEANYMRRSSGVNHFDGETALEYARIRYLDSDFGRTNRQRNVLNSLMKSFRDISLADAMKLVNEIFPLLTTDMSNGEIISYVTEILPILAKCGDINNMSIPSDGNYYSATIRSMMVLVPDLSACRQQLEEELR